MTKIEGLGAGTAEAQNEGATNEPSYQNNRNNATADSRRLNPTGRWSTALPKTALAAALLRALARKAAAP